MLLALAALAVLSGPDSHRDHRFFNQLKVYIRVISVDATSGRCWEPLDFCGKPDYFVTADNVGTGQAPFFVTSVVLNAMHVGNPAPADWSTGPMVVNRPGRLTFAVYDADGAPTDAAGDGSIQDDMRSRTDLADINPGPESSVTLDLEPLIGAGEQTLTYEGGDTKLVVAVLVELVPGRLTDLQVSLTAFRPSDGLPIDITAVGTGGPSLTFTIYGPAGSSVYTTTVAMPSVPASAPAGEEARYTLQWAGLDAAGVPLPPGEYVIDVAGLDPMPLPAGRSRTIPESMQKKVIISPPLSVATLALQPLDPNPWAPETGPLRIRVVGNTAITVGAKVFSGFYCTGTPVATWTIGPLTPGTPTNYLWDGTTAAGMMVTPGPFNLQLIGDAPNLTGYPICERFDVVTAPTPLIVVRHTPFLASPGQTVTITALAVDPGGNPRRVNRLDVAAEASVLGGAPSTSVPAPIATCAFATSCTATLVLPASPSRLAWKGDARDGTGAVQATSGWRGQSVIRWASVSQAAELAVPVDEALSGALMTNPTAVTATEFDVVLNVSTQFQFTNALDLADIGAGLNGFMLRLWGLEGLDTPSGSTFLVRQDLVHVFLALEQTEVNWSGNANLCTWSVPFSPWADARGVLHRVSCRDNANHYYRTFSAQLLSPEVVVHELHHALFGLADEYVNVTVSPGVRGGDGGYSVSAELPNVFNNMADCVAVTGRPPGGCTSIAEVATGSNPPALSGRVFFRLDDPTMTDIMDRNGRQRFAEIRQALFRGAACANGDC